MIGREIEISGHCNLDEVFRILGIVGLFDRFEEFAYVTVSHADLMLRTSGRSFRMQCHAKYGKS